MDPQIKREFRDLLLKLPKWDQERRRRTLIEAALGEHRILSEVRIEGDTYDVAWELASACADFQEPTFQGLSPMCAFSETSAPSTDWEKRNKNYP